MQVLIFFLVLGGIILLGMGIQFLNSKGIIANLFIAVLIMLLFGCIIGGIVAIIFAFINNSIGLAILGIVLIAIGAFPFVMDH